MNNGWSGTWYRKNYIRKFAAQAYNYIACYTDYSRYKTTVSKLHVKVPAWLTIFDPIGGSNERNPHTYTRRGPFSKSEFVAGAADGWNHMMSPDNVLAHVQATGLHPSTGDEHSTEAFAPTEESAVNIIIECGICLNAECPTCTGYR